MFIAAFACLALLSVVLAGGSLMRLADVRLAGGRYIGAAIVLQILIISVLPGSLDGIHAPVHLFTYALAGAFMWANRRIAGLWLIAAGGAANFAAIAANGGVMPASASALRAAGLTPDKGEAFANSAALERPRLALLGDVFAIPDSWPLANVLSLGDLLVMAGLVVTLHVLSGSRLAPRGGAPPFVELFRTPRFGRLWAAQATSNVGDFVYSLAVSIGVIETGGGVSLLATVLLVQTGPAIVAGLVGAPLVDRLSRRRLMVGADVARAAAVASLVVAGSPSTGHILAVAACLGAFGAVFQPALQASLPNLVPPRLLMTANATMTATFHVAVLAGPVLGGFLATRFGATAAFAVNGASFLVSACLLAGLPIGAPVRDAAAEPEEEEGGARAILAGLRFAAGSAVVRVVVLGCAGAMFAATLKQPLEPVFIVRDLGGLARDVGLAAGAWGLGMLLGSFAAPGLARRLRRERLMAVGTATMGLAVAGAALAQGPGALVWLWLVAGAGNALLSVSYETLLL
ncbi:MAG TPA: MFS transporter, partial [Solirubrobacteraceae bacterium]